MQLTNRVIWLERQYSSLGMICTPSSSSLVCNARTKRYSTYNILCSLSFKPHEYYVRNALRPCTATLLRTADAELERTISLLQSYFTFMYIGTDHYTATRPTHCLYVLYTSTERYIAHYIVYTTIYTMQSIYYTQIIVYSCTLHSMAVYYTMWPCLARSQYNTQLHWNTGSRHIEGGRVRQLLRTYIRSNPQQLKRFMPEINNTSLTLYTWLHTYIKD